MAEVRFDNVEALNAAAGEFGEWGPSLTVTQEMINQFADLTGDHQWIYVDVERTKKESPFGGPIAHGFLTLSLVPHLAPRNDPTIVGHQSAANYGAEKLRFMSPARSESEIHSRLRLVRVEAKPRGTLITSEIEVAVVGAERPSLLYAMQILYMAR